LDVCAADYWELFWRIYSRIAARKSHSLTLAAN
jgi:hypothetical protein